MSSSQSATQTLTNHTDTNEPSHIRQPPITHQVELRVVQVLVPQSHLPQLVANSRLVGGGEPRNQRVKQLCDGSLEWVIYGAEVKGSAFQEGQWYASTSS